MTRSPRRDILPFLVCLHNHKLSARVLPASHSTLKRQRLGLLALAIVLLPSSLLNTSKEDKGSKG